MLKQEILEICEEFIDQVVNENRDEELDFAMGSLRDFLAQEVDGHTMISKQKFAYAVQCRLEEIWGLVSTQEKQVNLDLAEYYDEAVSFVETFSDHEAEKSSSALFDDEDCDDEEIEDGYGDEGDDQ